MISRYVAHPARGCLGFLETRSKVEKESIEWNERSAREKNIGRPAVAKGVEGCKRKKKKRKKVEVGGE